MRPCRSIVAAALLVWAPLAAAGATAPPGASACSGCHAPPGSTGAIPALRGRPAEEIAARMRSYRDGERAATVMGRIARGFTDDEIQAIAAWLAAQP
jgi:cytochrome c553